MALYSIKMTLAATTTPQAPTAADFVTAGIKATKTKAANVVVANETGGGAGGIRVGGPNVHLGNKIGMPILPGAQQQLPFANERNAHDILTTYVSGTIGDIVNYVWVCE